MAGRRRRGRDPRRGCPVVVVRRVRDTNQGTRRGRGRSLPCARAVALIRVERREHHG
jgi:hypothetical protein